MLCNYIVMLCNYIVMLNMAFYEACSTETGPNGFITNIRKLYNMFDIIK